ncbi:hypothetical protein TRFO_05632 [Tritrichomonas foetus]|uniref:Uncharacterized protein n=1 Tax=Tritrichomonas foetus TaxID=1144522 RepID=A0A1J4K9N5_9EUKA|nr:hypothetical protein TRFO_05632 [Tritrichomonas foetus]|eukprot:OHT06420.1 hypothetical protein TRFO_05632 [Tritrichomonas foetus]
MLVDQIVLNDFNRPLNFSSISQYKIANLEVNNNKVSRKLSDRSFFEKYYNIVPVENEDEMNDMFQPPQTQNESESYPSSPISGFFPTSYMTVQQIPAMIVLVPMPAPYTMNPNLPIPSTHFHDRHKHPVHYEKDRIAKVLKTMDTVNVHETAPYQWMKKEFGRAITQKEFNHIYPTLKLTIPGKFAPNRDASRNQKVKFYWLAQIWNNEQVREIVQNLIQKVMLPTF